MTRDRVAWGVAAGMLALGMVAWLWSASVPPEVSLRALAIRKVRSDLTPAQALRLATEVPDCTEEERRDRVATLTAREPDEAELRAYYHDNRALFGERSFVISRVALRQIVVLETALAALKRAGVCPPR